MGRQGKAKDIEKNCNNTNNEHLVKASKLRYLVGGQCYSGLTKPNIFTWNECSMSPSRKQKVSFRLQKCLLNQKLCCMNVLKMFEKNEKVLHRYK